MAAKSKMTSNRDTLAKLRAHVSEIEHRLELADHANERATSALRTAFDSLGTQSGANEQALRAHTDRLATHLNDLIIKTRKDVSADLKKTLANPQSSTLKTAIEAANKKITQAEITQAEAIGKINTQITQLARTLEQRFTDQTQARNALDTRLTARIDDVENNTAERISSIEQQTAGAVTNIGERIVALSDEMSARRDQLKESLHERVLEVSVETQQELGELKTEMARRFDATHEQLGGQTTPLSRQIATLAARMDALEGGLQASISTAPQNVAPPFPAAPQIEQAASAHIDAFSPPPAPVLETPVSAPPPMPPVEISAIPEDGPIEFNPASYDVQSNVAPLYPQNVAPAVLPHATPQTAPYNESYAPPSPYMPEYDPTNPYAQAANMDALHADAGPAELSDNYEIELSETMETARPGGEQSQKAKKSLFSSRTLRTGASAAAILAIATFGALSVKNMLGTDDRQMQVVNGEETAQNPDSPWQQNANGENAPNYDVTLQKPTGQIASADGTVGRMSTSINADHNTLDAAVAAGNSVAQLQKGLSLMQAGQKEQAASLIRLSANQGQPAAQYYLGHMYENGDGVQADSLQARKLTEMAAQSGHRIAMYDVALYYIEGKGGVDINMNTAAQWFRKAADYGMVDAQYNLAVLHERGTGVARNLAESYVWFTIAGANGDQDSAQRAEQIKAMLAGDELGRAEARIAGFRPAQIDNAANGIFTNLAWNKSPAPKRDERVVKVQEYLTGLGYEAGIVDGAMGPQTRSAIKDYERANGLTETGQVDDALLARLSAASGA